MPLEKKLACVSVTGKGATDAFLAEIAVALEGAGLRLAGTIQSNPERIGRRRCDMDIRVLPDGPTLRISEDRGDLAMGCRLDAGVLEEAVVEVGRRLSGADLLVVNKFGKREAEGKGLVTIIAEAVDSGMPVLLGVNGLNLQPLRDFAGDMLQELPAERDAVMAWARAAVQARVPTTTPG